jgi:hypothetical protein
MAEREVLERDAGSASGEGAKEGPETDDEESSEHPGVRHGV